MRLQDLSIFMSMLIAGIIFSHSAMSAKTGTGPAKLEDVTVEATRVEESLYDIPASVGQVDKTDIQLGRQQLGIDEALNKVPGLFMQNRHNFNQDLSISIRGFGVADFGIRGLKIFVDGIPNTLADGQSGIDNIDIGSIESMEVIRGPSSTLYGSAAGGVINIKTEDGTPVPFIEGRVTAGSHDFKQAQVKTGGQKGRLNYLVSVQKLDFEGHRQQQGKIERHLLNSKFRWEFDNTSDLTFIANILDKPIAEDPGSLSRAQFTANREQIHGPNIAFDSGETVDQQQFGLVYNKRFNEHHETTARNYYVFREFDTKLPFGPGLFPGATGGIVTFDRVFIGGGLQHTYTDQFLGHYNRLTFGFDIDSQMDERKNFDNNMGQIGQLRFNQDEDVFNWGVFLQNEFDITDYLQLRFGVRYDEVEFDFTDKFLADGDQSGTKKFEEWSPSVGLLWSVHEAVNLYGTISTSFETPTTSEFATPTGTGGLNQALDAQTATNYEIGVKGLLPGRANYQLAVFTMDVSNELVPAGENPIGSDFFNSAGETSRTGVEASVTFRPLRGLEVTLNYTYSDLEFESFIIGGNNFAGNTLPGHPEHFGFAEIAYFHPSGFFAVLDGQAVDKVVTDNANTEAADGYAIANFRMGHTGYVNDLEISPFVGVNNIFDSNYIGNVRVNAPGNRFFEPAPEFNIFAGLSVTYR